MDGRESSEAVTSQQPRSPSLPPNTQRERKRKEGEGEGEEEEEGERESSALEAAEQQIVLIHEEYKKLLREKEVQ